MQILNNNISNISDITDSMPNTGSRGSSYAWRRTRQKILERDLYTCQNCGLIGGNLEVDHIDRNPHNNDLINLQTLCRECHEVKTKLENTSALNYQIHSKNIKMISKYDN